jgi:hypothetical protein
MAVQRGHLCLGYTSSKVISEAILVKGREELQDCEMLSIPHCLSSQNTYGGKVVSLMRRPSLCSSKTFVYFWHPFLLEAG